MPRFETVAATEAYRERCEDRVAVFADEDRTVVVVADGAGGTGSGDIAAQMVIREIQNAYPHIHSATQWEQLLRQVDCRITPGESTAVVVDLRPYGMAGASVGDSQAWSIADGVVDELTLHQHRKPLLGSGNANPTCFLRAPLAGTLLVATDGLFDYAKRAKLTAKIATSEFSTIPRVCIELVRLPSGELWDDIGVIAVRNAIHRRPRRRYVI